MRYQTAFLGIAFAWLVALPASATPEFPTVIQSKLTLASAPPCTICHQNLAGGKGTVTQPFGMNMIAHGLVEFDDDSLVSALLIMGDEGVISASGCRSDIDELEAGGDPNHPNAVAPCMATGGAAGAGGATAAGTGGLAAGGTAGTAGTNGLAGQLTAGGPDTPDAGLPQAGTSSAPLPDDPSALPVPRYGCRGNTIASAALPSNRALLGALMALLALTVGRRRPKARSSAAKRR